LYISADWYKPRARDLTDEQASLAAQYQIVEPNYPQIVRSHTDPAINSQGIGCVSYLFLPQPVMSKHNKPIYGFMKLRGNWPDKDYAWRESEKIVRTIDSKFKIRFAPV
jgi:hypothetical protein